MQRWILLGTLLMLVVAGCGQQEYLKEKPSFLTPCHLHGPPDEACLKSAFENLFTNWRNGIPGLKHVGTIDPFHVKRVRLSQRTENVADIHADLQNVVATGMSDTKMLKVSVNEKDYTFSFLLHTPSVKVDGDYKLKGRILLLNLDGQGKLKTEIKDLEYSVVAKANLKKIGEEYFFDILSISSKINKIGKFHIHFTNLFGGNKELEDSAHLIFNENWRDLFEIMRPAIGQTLDTMILDRYKRIYSYIPAKFFLDDLP